MGSLISSIFLPAITTCEFPVIRLTPQPSGRAKNGSIDLAQRPPLIASHPSDCIKEQTNQGLLNHPNLFDASSLRESARLFV